MELLTLSRPCPSCNNSVYHRTEKSLKLAVAKASKCRSCASKGVSKGKGRKQGVEHVQKRAKAVALFRKGKTYAEIYGKDLGERLSKEHSAKLKGRKRPEFSEQWKANMSQSRKTSETYKNWMNSTDYKEKRKAINAARFYNMTLEEWYSMVSEKKLYYLEVRAITRKQALSTLENFEKRGTSKNNGYHLDHIYPISIGFTNNISATIIGNIKNLQYIPWKENLQKSNKLK